MRATFDATGEVLLVTGGSRGIGAAAAVAYAAAGGTAVVLDTSPARCLERHARIEQHQVDVADRAAVLDCVGGVVARHGRVDGLIAGAAVQPRSDVVSMDPAEWRHTLAVNLDGVVWSSQAVLPCMIAQRSGTILVFGSGLGHTGRAQASAYAASKAALVAYARSLAAEVAEHQVRVNVVFPGVIDTAQFRAANPDGGEREHWARTTGIGAPEDVVDPLLFLLSDAATMTGSLLSRDRSYRKE